ncbi:MAG: dTMP kinase [Candidatus Asgardarchaeum californiense]|nr:MAG: dTMP kinase [Candidatus Asgardarchaeum californiense]
MAAGEKQEMKHFVTFEGIDGSGKSTISKIVFKKLKNQGYDVILTQEPTNTWVGKQVQKCIESHTDPFVTSFTFIADRIQHCQQIQKWLDDDKIVLCDRYAESTYAYQGVQLEELVNNPIKWLKELSKDRILTPDRTFVFVIKPESALARIQHRDNLIPFEKQAFLEKVHENYLKLAKGNRFLKIDAIRPKNELIKICMEDILS